MRQQPVVLSMIRRRVTFLTSQVSGHPAGKLVEDAISRVVDAAPLVMSLLDVDLSVPG